MAETHIGTEYERIQKEVLEKLKLDDNDDYERLERDPEALKKVETAMKNVYHIVGKMLENADTLENALGHLTPEHKGLIETTFRLQSFNVDMKYQPNGVVVLKFASLTGDPLSFAPLKVEIDSNNYEKNRVLLAARIILEILILVLNLIGIKVKPSNKAVAETIEFICKLLSATDSLLDCIDRMAKAKNNMEIAKAILACLIDLFSLVSTPILKITKILLQDMSWLDIIIAVGEVLCYIATIIATGGTTVIMKLITWLLSATAFLLKLTQFLEFQNYQLK